MAFDGFITKSVISELKNSIIGAKVNKIFEPTKNEVVLGLYNNGINYALNICIDPELCRICLTTRLKPNPQNAFNFCMLLRKYLIGSRIIDISNYDLERTIEIKFECYNELNDLVVRKLFIEIMSRQSNIVLTNEKNIIIDSIKHTDTGVRELLPAHEYTLTSINKISFAELMNISEFITILRADEEANLVKKLTNTFIGFSKPFVKENLKYLNIDEDSYSDNDLETLYKHIKDIVEGFGTSKISVKKIDSKEYTLVLEENDNNLNINFFLDDFYFQKEKEAIFINSRNNLLRIISDNLKKVYRKLENINSKIKECDRMGVYKLYGELLTANLYKLNKLPNTDKVTVENYYDDNKTIEIPLDSSISVGNNIEKYFKKYNKLKNALEIVAEQKKETTKEIDYVESILFSLENATSINDINEVYEEISENIIIKVQNKKQQKKKIKKNDESLKLESTEIQGHSVFIGKNNIQNDYLTLKFAEKNDIWFHTGKIHGSHVLLKTNGETDIEESILLECAKIAMKNSKASKSSNVPVDYCFAKYVKKVSGSKPRNGSIY